MDQLDTERSLELGRLSFKKLSASGFIRIALMIFLRIIFIFGLMGGLLALLGEFYVSITIAFLWLFLVPFILVIYSFILDLRLDKVDLSQEQVLDDYFQYLLESRGWALKESENMIYAYQIEHRLMHHLYILFSNKSVYFCALCDGPIPINLMRKNEIMKMIKSYSSYVKET